MSTFPLGVRNKTTPEANNVTQEMTDGSFCDSLSTPQSWLLSHLKSEELWRLKDLSLDGPAGSVRVVLGGGGRGFIESFP